MVVIALVVCGCNDEKDPVDVPFEGLEVPGGDDNDKKQPSSAPEPTAAETSAPQLTPAPRPTASRLGSCCGALRGASQSSRDEGGRKMYDQAAKVCSGLMGEVTRGKLTEGQALSQVRSSLLGPAPSACR
jgi:hypothetical protein